MTQNFLKFRLGNDANLHSPKDTLDYAVSSPLQIFSTKEVLETYRKI